MNYIYQDIDSASASAAVEREHMFDKVVTPSDVGKLNRLVIPKQHAEKYFPLDSSSNEKGLLLNFEDRHGKPWRFRYSYWNSSQSYVMTKGWSRFVKEKKLDAGDIVSFHRGLGDAHKDRLFIDWRRRPDSAADHHVSFHRPGYGIYGAPFHGNPCPVVYLRGGPQGFAPPRVVFDSVPVVEGKAAAKRLRLFGVNMECPISESDECDINILSSTTLSSMPPHTHLFLPPPESDRHPDYKGKASMSLDLDI